MSREQSLEALVLAAGAVKVRAGGSGRGLRGQLRSVGLRRDHQFLDPCSDLGAVVAVNGCDGMQKGDSSPWNWSSWERLPTRMKRQVGSALTRVGTTISPPGRG